MKGVIGRAWERHDAELGEACREGMGGHDAAWGGVRLNKDANFRRPATLTLALRMSLSMSLMCRKMPTSMPS